jgi:alkaline phosphatase
MYFVCPLLAFGQAKYVFYFIGDGMGVNHINLTEAYLSAMNGGRGKGALLMTQFPFGTFSTSFSESSDVTDSAASGTALSTGTKTNNGYIGLTPDEQPLETVAEKARKKGMKVGVASTVPVNHATPAAFYGHRKNRNMYYEIGEDLLVSGFDFFAGAGMLNRDKKYDKSQAPDIYPLIEQAGYVIADGYDNFKTIAATSDKTMLLPKDWQKSDVIPYSIDRSDKDLRLSQIVEAAITSLMRDNRKGFFAMFEGGRIDWAAHANDGAAVVQEVIDLDEAVKVAYEFYLKHPKQTLIVITADHETGGLAVGRGSLTPETLQYQHNSKDGLSELLTALVKSKNGKVSWEEVKQFLTEQLSFWNKLKISPEDEKTLRDAYDKTLAKQIDIEDANLYSANPLIISKAVKILNDLAGLGWASGSHSAGYIPVFAIGAGAELFSHKMDNIDIPKNIIKAAKLR